MKKGGIGGANTQTGLRFEEEVDFVTLISRVPGYTVRQSAIAGMDVLFEDEVQAICFQKYDFYRFLKHHDVNWKEIISSQLLPDDAILVVLRDTLFILEIKYQQRSGSTDEKLQTCDFKKKQYTKLVFPLGLRVEYIYVLSDWFKKPKYKDVLNYVHSMNCHYTFDEIPLAWLGLPTRN